VVVDGTVRKPPCDERGDAHRGAAIGKETTKVGQRLAFASAEQTPKVDSESARAHVTKNPGVIASPARDGASKTIQVNRSRSCGTRLYIRIRPCFLPNNRLNKDTPPEKPWVVPGRRACASNDAMSARERSLENRRRLIRQAVSLRWPARILPC
jgi:hypothetical protein